MTSANSETQPANVENLNFVFFGNDAGSSVRGTQGDGFNVRSRLNQSGIREESINDDDDEDEDEEEEGEAEVEELEAEEGEAQEEGEEAQEEGSESEGTESKSQKDHKIHYQLTLLDKQLVTFSIQECNNGIGI